MKNNILGFILIFWGSSAYCQSSLSVSIYGSLKGIMHENDTTEKVRLNLLGPLTNVYGLGAVAGLDGEILILNGGTFVTRAWNGSLATDKSSDVGAALLVTASIPAWDTLSIDSDVNSIKELEDLVSGYQNSQSDPLPFLILAKEGSIKWHVIKRPENTQEMTDHKALGQEGRYSGSVLILGFYSTLHQGIFTHQGQNVHLHFQSSDKLYAGHVDELNLKKGDKLLIPK